MIVPLKSLTILVKRSILDACLGPKCASAGGLGPKCASAGRYNIVVKIQMEVSPWQQAAIKMTSFWSTLIV